LLISKSKKNHALAIFFIAAKILCGEAVSALRLAGILWRGRLGLASRWHLAGGKKQGQDALATWTIYFMESKYDKSSGHRQTCTGRY
jgi:hypothetical protein